MISAAVIDDEAPARARVKNFLSAFNEISPVHEAENGSRALELIDRVKPDLIFLDIQMPVVDGFEVLARCRHRPAVIFVTAFDEYALKAFEVNAVDYLLKPYSRERFEKSVRKVLSSLEGYQLSHDKIESIYDYYRRREDFLERITVKKGYIYQVIEVKDIDFFQIKEGLIFLYTKDRSYQIDVSLNHLEKRLDPSLFFRSHRNSIVNLKKIRDISPWLNGKYALNMPGDNRIFISRDRVGQFRKLIGLRF